MQFVVVARKYVLATLTLAIQLCNVLHYLIMIGSTEDILLEASDKTIYFLDETK